jgi:DNA ligase (NAD+)
MSKKIISKDFSNLYNVKDYEKMEPKKLEKFLREANELYRNGAPIISDEIYDYLIDLLKEKDPTNTFLTEIGAPVVDEKTKAVLPYKMFSLDKVKNEENPLRLWRSKFPGNIVVSDKLDGNSGLLYIKDKKIYLYTRGNGEIGQDISYLVPYISFFRNDKLKNFVLDNYNEFAIRGELILSKDDWKTIKAKYPELSNDRNTVAGTLNAKSPNYDILKKIRFVAYEWITAKTLVYNDLEELGPFKPSEYFEFMYKLGLEVAESRIIKAKDISLESLSQFLEERRNIGKYVIDGIVVTENEVHERDDTGNPKYSFAFKSLATQEQAEVTVIDIEWNISKDGLLKPLVLFPPIELDGVIMRKATGKNAKFIEENVVGIGSKIIITRAGGVIPDIIGITKASDSGVPKFPSDIDYVWNDNHIEIMVNVDKVSDKMQDIWDLKRLVYFFVTLETDGVSEGVIARLFDAGFDTVKKIIHIKIDDLLKIEGFKQRSSQKVRASITDALVKASTLRFMKASNMFEGGIGEKKLKLIADIYPDILNKEKRFVPPLDGLLSIPGIAEITAENFLDCLPNFWTFVEDNDLLQYIGIAELATPKTINISSEYKDFLSKTFVFSGFRNKIWEEKVGAAGGTVASGVTKKVNYLIVKDKSESSNKIEKAKELGIPIFNLDEVKDKFE